MAHKRAVRQRLRKKWIEANPGMIERARAIGAIVKLAARMGIHIVVKDIPADLLELEKTRLTLGRMIRQQRKNTHEQTNADEQRANEAKPR